MCSDAQISKTGVQVDQLDVQPVNVWYGKNNSLSHQQGLKRTAHETEVTSDHWRKKSRVESFPGDVSDEEPDDEVDSSCSNTRGQCGPPYPGSPPPLLPPDGTGTMIAILDSGINLSHEAFTNKISPASKSFTEVIPSDDINDMLGHGTQCAGLACGAPVRVFQNSTDFVEFKGIAPNAKVLVCKVVPDGKVEADLDAVCRALEYIIEYNKQCNTVDARVVVASLSFGMSFFNRMLSKKIQEVIYNDIVVVCAASNDGRRKRQSIVYPARLGHVLCIGSCNSHCKPSPFTPVGREIDFLAPGEDIWAPTVGVPNTYASVSGTSFAAPLVGGVICQIVQDLKKIFLEFETPELLDHLINVWGMRELLKHMSVVQGTHDEERGFGALEPMEYFEKSPHEKINIVLKLVGRA